jgi:hypothetical protein
MKYKLLLLIFFAVSFAWAQNNVPIKYSVFLLGDDGAPVLNGQDKTLQMLRKQLEEAQEKSTIIYLGDNIYQWGMPDAEHKDRKEAEARIIEQLRILENYKGKYFFIAGNHDWQQGRKDGLIHLQNQEKFVENYLNGQNVFLPDAGCPDPVELLLNQELTLILMDTQWWLQPDAYKPDENNDCSCKNKADVIARLDDILLKNKDKKILLAGHHPMYTYGEHNGYATLKTHIFPLTAVNKKLYIPLPVLGSVMPLYRSVFGNIQDVHHVKYRQMIEAIKGSLSKYPNAIYANGHDHSLQYIYRDNLHFITSGAGSKHSPVRKGKYALFAESQKGFARLDYLENGQIRLQFWEERQPEKAIFETFLQPQNLAQNTQNKYDSAFSPSSPQVATFASKQYHGNGLKKALLGKNYRQEWEENINVSVFDFRVDGKSLKITQRGGGMQTKSLRLEDSLGNEYVLRSIEKNPESAIPQVFRKTAFADLVQDQISAAHPYGALGLPELAQAADVPHAHPKIVFIADDPRLGQYQELFKNTLAIFEERSLNEKNYSTPKVIEKLQEDNDNHVNQENVLKARLLDLFIGDWDRHDDQWRWIADKKGKGATFSPVPRDRDQAFFVNEGLIPYFVSRNWALPKIQGFGYKVRDVRTFMFNGRYFDRSFLTQLSKETWIKTARDLQSKMTDEVIEKAIKQLPESVFKIRGQEIIDKLKYRRQNLVQEAEKYYDFLAEKVAVVGSDKAEYFSVKRLSNTETLVKVYKITKDGDTGKVLYERLFYTRETAEIHLYGLGGNDIFKVDGSTKKGIKIRIIGGEGKDIIEDNSHVNGMSKKTLVYDTKAGNELKINAETQNRTSEDTKVNLYDRKSFKYDIAQPLLSFAYNPDDGIFLGGGVLIKKQGFRRDPFKVQHKLTANHAFATKAYNFDYQGDFTNVFKKTDLQLNAEIKAPNFTSNFFGLGNETQSQITEQGINYYRVRFENWDINALLRRKLGTKIVFFGGANFERVEIEESTNRFVNDFTENGLDANSVFQGKKYLGFLGGFQMDNRDNKIMPTEGILWKTDFKMMKGVGDFSQNYSQLHSEISFFWSFRLPANVTLATRFGGGINFSDYEFFQANTLGGLTNLRGFRRTRFAGANNLYNNTELRIRLFSFRTYLFPAYFGILGFHDVGRVWQKNESSGKWHNGYGGGIWLAPFQQLVISGMYGFSEEGSLPSVKVGFFF